MHGHEVDVEGSFSLFILSSLENIKKLQFSLLFQTVETVGKSRQINFETETARSHE